MLEAECMAVVRNLGAVQLTVIAFCSQVLETLLIVLRLLIKKKKCICRYPVKIKYVSINNLIASSVLYISVESLTINEL